MDADSSDVVGCFGLFFGFFLFLMMFSWAIAVFRAFSEGSLSFESLAVYVSFPIVLLVLATLLVFGWLRSRREIVVGPEDVCAFAGRRRDAAEWREPLSAFDGIRCRWVEGGESNTKLH